MFDIGSAEMLVVVIVALIVLGPERIPKVVRTIGLIIGRARAMLRSVQAEMERELNPGVVRDLKLQLNNPTQPICEDTADQGSGSRAAQETQPVRTEPVAATEKADSSAPHIDEKHEERAG